MRVMIIDGRTGGQVSLGGVKYSPSLRWRLMLVGLLAVNWAPRFHQVDPVSIGQVGRQQGIPRRRRRARRLESGFM